MKFIAAASAALLSTVAALDVQSKPFHLFFVSDDKSLHGKPVGVTHTGANIQSLVPGRRTVFYHSTAKGSEPPIKGSTPEGFLTTASEAPIDNPFQQNLKIETDLFSSLATNTFGTADPDDGTYVTIAKDGILFLNQYNDKSQATAIRRWYVCDKTVGAYRGKYVLWNIGEGKPADKTCVKVDLKKVKI